MPTTDTLFDLWLGASGNETFDEFAAQLTAQVEAIPQPKNGERFFISPDFESLFTKKLWEVLKPMGVVAVTVDRSQDYDRYLVAVECADGRRFGRYIAGSDLKENPRGAMLETLDQLGGEILKAHAND